MTVLAKPHPRNTIVHRSTMVDLITQSDVGTAMGVQIQQSRSRSALLRVEEPGTQTLIVRLFGWMPKSELSHGWMISALP